MKSVCCFLTAGCFFLSTLVTPVSALVVGDFDVKPFLSLNAAYDDNITYDNDNEKDDFVSTTSFGLTARGEGKTHIINLRGGLDYNAYSKHTNFNHFSQEISADLFKELSEYSRLNVGDTLTHSEDPSDFADEFGREPGRYRYLRNRFTIGASRDLDKYTTVSGQYTNGIDDYSRGDLRDSYLNALSGKIAYDLTSHVSMEGMYQFHHRGFSGGFNSYINTGACGARYYFYGDLYADALTGLDFIHMYNNDDIMRPLLDLALTSMPDERSSATLSFSKRYETSASVIDVFDRWQVSAEARRQLYERLYGSAEVFYGEGEFEVTNVRDDFSGLGLRLAYEISEEVNVDAHYRYSQIDSSDFTRAYSKNYFGAGIRVAF